MKYPITQKNLIANRKTIPRNLDYIATEFGNMQIGKKILVSESLIRTSGRETMDAKMESKF